MSTSRKEKKLVLEFDWGGKLFAEEEEEEEEVVSLKDITERKEAEEQLLYAERLAGVGELAAGVAHEIRNPLANIIASAQFSLSKFTLDEKLKKHFDIILRNSENAERIIKDLLNFAKPSSVPVEGVNVAEIINRACDLVKGRCSQQRVWLIKKFSKGLPPIMADENGLEQAFLNLIINALDAMPEGGKLAITASLDARTNDIAVRFSDTGKGIPQENLNKIFNPFFTTKEDGTGLGLSLVHRIIDFHKGKINIESEMGKGTEVIVRLPVS